MWPWSEIEALKKKLREEKEKNRERGGERRREGRKAWEELPEAEKGDYVIEYLRWRAGNVPIDIETIWAYKKVTESLN